MRQPAFYNTFMNEFKYRVLGDPKEYKNRKGPEPFEKI